MTMAPKLYMIVTALCCSRVSKSQTAWRIGAGGEVGEGRGWGRQGGWSSVGPGSSVRFYPITLATEDSYTSSSMHLEECPQALS